MPLFTGSLVTPGALKHNGLHLTWRNTGSVHGGNDYRPHMAEQARMVRITYHMAEQARMVVDTEYMAQTGVHDGNTGAHRPGPGSRVHGANRRT